MKKNCLIAIILFLMASTQGFSQQSAIDSLQKLLAAAKTDTTRIDLMIELAITSLYTTPDYAIRLCSSAAESAKKIKDYRREALALNRMGGAHFVKGNLADALNQWQTSLGIAQSINDASLIARNLGNIGSIYSEIGNYDMSLIYKVKSLNMFESIGHQERISMQLNNIGGTYNHLNQYDSAELFFKRALPIAMQHSRYLLSTIYSNLAEIALAKQQYTQAAAYHTQSLQLAQQYGNKREQSISYRVGASIDLATGLISNARKKATFAIQLAKDTQSKLELYRAYEIMSKILFAEQDYLHAYKAIDSAIAYKDSVQSQTTKNALQIFEYERKQGELARLQAQKNSELAQKKREQQWLLAAIAAILATATGVTLVVVRSRRKMARVNQLLQQKNEEVATQKLQLENIVQARTQEIKQAYDNTRLLSDIGQDIISLLHVEKIVETVYSKIHLLMDAPTFAICLYDDQQRHLEFFTLEHGERLPNGFNSIDDESRLAAWCFVNQKEIFINDLAVEDIKYLKKRSRTTVGKMPSSLIYLPLTIQSKKIGAITVQSFQKNAYTQYHLDLMRSIASYVAIALDNAILYQGLEQKVKERTQEIQQAYHNVELLNEIGKKITSKIYVEDIVQTVYNNVNEIMDADTFLIGLHDPDKNSIETVMLEKSVLFPTFSYYLTESNRPAVWCFERGEELLMQDVYTDYPKYFPDYEHPKAKLGETTESLVYLPLMAKERIIGVLSVQSFRKHAYNEYHLNMLRNMAIYAAIALENADSFRQIEQQNIKISAQKEELAATIDNLRATQDQLVQSEKLAVMGKLVASVAHEINTPLGAIRASAGNIANDLKDSLQELPRLFELLDESKKECFFQLTAKALENHQLVSSREERQIRKKLQAELEAAGIALADDLAYELAGMGIYEDIASFMPLFEDAQAAFILKTAYHLVNQQRSTANIQLAVDRASKVVFALKTYARHDHSGEKVQANLQNGLETVLTLYHNQLKQGVEVVRNYDTVPEIWCYPDELNQVWTNLIHNAIQAMNNKGVLTVGIRQEKEAVIVSVGDTGKGIPEEIKHKIFEPFFTTKPAGEGSGLGLDICKKIIAKHNGTLSFESETDNGTTFFVTLPIA